jgi:tetratricopeptide (TPR) repeat protein
MSDVFISYSREDRGRAQQLASVFEQQGWTVWWDKVIPPGMEYSEVIAQQLAAAKAVVVLWSRTSAESVWVRDEAQEGATRRNLVSVLVEQITPPLGFRQFQAGDLSGWAGSPEDENLRGVLQSVAELIKKPYTPPPAEERPAPPARLTWLYLVVGVAVFAFLVFAAYRLLRAPGTGTNVDNKSLVVGNGNSGQQQPSPAGCSREARIKAADLTGKGLTYIDPGGNRDAAILQFNEAIAECPEYVDAYNYRGQAYAVLGRNDRAISDFNKVIELSSDPVTDGEAQKFIASLGAAPPQHQPSPKTPPETPSNTQSANTSGGATPTPAGRNANAVVIETGTEPPRVQVRDIFAAEKTTRINATTRLIIEKKNDPAAVHLAVQTALAHPENKSGVINTLVYLESVDPSILKQFRPEIEKLLVVAEKNGSQTVDHVKKIRARIGGGGGCVPDASGLNCP